MWNFLSQSCGVYQDIGHIFTHKSFSYMSSYEWPQHSEQKKELLLIVLQVVPFSATFCALFSLLKCW